MSRAPRYKLGAGSLHAMRAYPPADLPIRRSFLLLATEGQTRKVVERIEPITNARRLSTGVWVLSDPFSDMVLDELEDLLPREVFCRQCKSHLFCEFIADLADVLEAATLTVALLPNKGSHHVFEVGYGVDGRMRVGRREDKPRRSDDDVQPLRAESGSEDAGTYWRRYWATFKQEKLVQAAQILGLSWPTTSHAVRQAHRVLVLKHHPDPNGAHSSEEQTKKSEEQTKKINAARDELLVAMDSTT